MKRIFSTIGVLTIIILFNMGGCGGTDDISVGFKPAIDTIIFYESSDNLVPVETYQQGTKGVVELHGADYDLNAESIYIEINQCASSDCNTITGYRHDQTFPFKQSNLEFDYTFPDSISNIIGELKGTNHYLFAFEITDARNQTSTRVEKIIEINAGAPPKINKITFYHETYFKDLDIWPHPTRDDNDFAAKIDVNDADKNALKYYIKRTLVSDIDPDPEPVFSEAIYPGVTLSQETDPFSIILDDITSTGIVSLIEGFSVNADYQITIIVEDALGNTDEMSKIITINR